MVKQGPQTFNRGLRKQHSNVQLQVADHMKANWQVGQGLTHRLNKYLQFGLLLLPAQA